MLKESNGQVASFPGLPFLGTKNDLSSFFVPRRGKPGDEANGQEEEMDGSGEWHTII